MKYQHNEYQRYRSTHQQDQPAGRKNSSNQCLHKRHMKRLLTGAILIVFVLGFVVFYNTSYAQDIPNQSVSHSDIHTTNHTKYYRTVEITSGDTLWDIAETYMDDNYDSVKDYVQELKEVNHLTSDVIQDGQYLTVTYYL